MSCWWATWADIW